MTRRVRIDHFSLQDTLECGQFFRYTKCEGVYLVHSSDHLFSLRQLGPFLYYEGVEESFLVDFLRLEDDRSAILRAIEMDPTLREAIRRYPGLRLIRQDPWECLVSFLCSSAKAIPHIRTMIEGLCRASGRRIVCGNFLGYGFPQPGWIQRADQLDAVRAGFRADYLLQASLGVDRGRLLALKNMPYQEARVSLMRLAGVGKKIADCTLLYSLDFLEAFPIDTWIRKGLQVAYFRGRRVGEKDMERFVADHFGPFAGYAQLFLYHYWRNHPPGVRGS